MRSNLFRGARMGAMLAVVGLLPAIAGASTIAQNSSWTVTRPGASQTLRIVAYGDSIFAGYTSATNIARRSGPYVMGEYCAAAMGQNIQIHRRCQSGGVGLDIYNRIHSTTDRAFMADAATRIVTFEMCGNDYLQARSSFKSASGTCNYTGLNNALANCKNYTQLAMTDINLYAHANTKLKIVSNLYYPGFNADNSFSTCTDLVNGDPANGYKVTMQNLFLPRLIESNWWVCKYAADKGFVCADSFANFMARDYDSNADGIIDSDAIRYKKGESLTDYSARLLALRSTLRDANFKLANASTSFDYIQSDDTHPTFEGATASTFLTTPGGSNAVLNATAGAYPDGKNPHWNWNGHDRMGFGLNPGCPLVVGTCGNSNVDSGYLPSGNAFTEGCDDGNLNAADGCSSYCEVETGYFCTGSPSMCAPVCGDGLIIAGEQCDDGNVRGADGCSATCTFEPGFICTGGQPSTCAHICGDGFVVTGEGCDDGGLAGLDGCSSSCGVEAGWSCSGEPSLCAPVCGDGRIRGTEGCDDDNLNENDGCSITCNVENGWECSGEPSACTSICGDGLVTGTEQCDEADANGTGCCTTQCTLKAAGASCQDASACTVNETCTESGRCVSGGPRDCDDHNTCTNDTCNPTSGCASTNNTSSCDDGNACTTSDTCAAGACVGGAAPICNDGNGCTDDACNPASGCVATNNTAPCDDGNACTTSDTCAAGICVGGAAPICNDGNGCTDDTCNPASGCVATNNTLPCDDGNACTTSDTCAAGTCVGGAAPICNDGNGCTDDACNPASGCVATNNTLPCDDGNACTTSDTCAAGACVGGAAPNCNDGNGCTDDTCNPASGCVATNNTLPCDDGNACTTSDTCAAGTCVGGAAPNCNDGNGCTDDTCNPASGCVATNNTLPCDDGNACTTSDTCAAGTCVGGAAPICNDGNGCTDDTCNPASGCVATNNTLPCDDGNACTTSDTCAAGTCVGGAAPICNDGNGCTDDTCNPASGCVATNNTLPCDDGNACTTSDTCAAGICVGGAAPICNDGNGCTDDTCNPASGCVATNNTLPCDDGNACTTSDTCSAGACVGGAAPDCNDGSACTNDTCNPASGCVNTNLTGSCDDGNACTTGDTCAGGVCVGGAAPNCDDGNGCTDDTCNPASGCENANNTAPCDDGDECSVGEVCTAGSCTSSTKAVFGAACRWFVVGKLGGESDDLSDFSLTQGSNNAITGNICLGEAKIGWSTNIEGDLVTTAAGGAEGIKFGPRVTVTGDIVTGGAGIKGIQEANLPHLTPSVSKVDGGTTVAKDVLVGGMYDTTGTSPLLTKCESAISDVDAAQASLEALAADQTSGRTRIASDGSLDVLPTNVGALNVVEFQRLSGGLRSQLNLSGGGNPNTTMIVRINGKMSFRERCAINLVDGLKPENTILFVRGRKAQLDDLCNASGTIYAAGKIKIGSGVVIEGQILARAERVRLGERLVGVSTRNLIVLP